MSSNDPLAQLLGSFLGGGGGGGSGNLTDLMGALTQGGAAPGPADGAPPADPLAGFLEQMSQGGEVSQQPAGGMQGGGLPDMSGQGGELGQLLGAVLGGGMQQPAPGMGAPMDAPQGGVGIGDILGTVMGGGGTGIGASPLLAPIANLLSEKLGLPPAISQAVLAFVMAKLFAGSGAASGGRMGVAEEGPGMQDLLAQASSGQRIDKRTLQSTGLAEELAQHTGMDADTAATSLQQALKLLGPAATELGAAQ